MTDNSNLDVDPRIGPEREANQAGVYADGVEYFRRNGYRIEPHVTGQIGGHKVFRLSSPREIDGVTFPKNFKVWSEVANTTELELFRETVQSFINKDYDANKLWLPVLEPDPSRRKPLYGHAMSLINLASVEDQQRADLPVNYGVDPMPRVAQSGEKQGDVAPSSFVPLLDWFNPSLRELKVSDIVTLFPPAELEILSLIIGRGVVGMSGHVTPSGHVIKHTSRMAGIIYGRDPGLGKSFFFNELFNALKTCGYGMETFNTMGSRFNMGPVATSHFTYKDDVTTKTLMSFMSSEQTKIIITGAGYLKVEDKGTNAVNVKPCTVILLCCNEFNPRIVYEIDPGTADRLHILSTLREPEIAEKAGTIYGSPNLIPEFHLKYLAEKFGVSVKALMLYLARLCADKFLSVIEPGEVNLLKQEIHLNSHQLRKPLYKNTASQVFCYLIMVVYGQIEDGRKAMLIEKAKRHPDFPVSDIDWKTVIRDAAKVITLDDLQYWHDYLKWHFETLQPLNEFHPYLGFKMISPSFLIKAYYEADSLEDSPDVISHLFAHMRLGDGMPMPKDFVWINESWHSVIPQLKNICYIYSLGRAFMHHLEKLETYRGAEKPIDKNHMVMLKKHYTSEVKAKFDEMYEIYKDVPFKVEGSGISDHDLDCKFIKRNLSR